MPSAASIRAKIDYALGKVGPPVKTVLKRTVAVSGDRVIGLTTKQNTDVTLTPQPTYTQHASTLAMQGGKRINPGDYSIFCSTNVLSIADINNPNVMLVLVDKDGSKEVLKIDSYSTPQFKGEEIAVTVFAKVVSHE